MALPELNSNILENNEIVTTQVHDGAEVFTQVNNGNSVDSFASAGNSITVNHNVVPQVVTTLTEKGQDITTTVEGFWDVVWSVNGQTGDVIIDVVVGDFLPNTTFRKGAAILYNSNLYIARETFTTGQTFNQADWTKIEPVSAIAFNNFVSYAHYSARQAIWHEGAICVAKQEFTAGEDFDENDWDEVDSGRIKTIVSADDTVTVVEDDGSVDLSIGEALLGKVDAEEGKGLSSNDYTDEEKEKLDGIEDGAERNLANTVVDASYVHTDNNYTNEEKSDVAEIDGIVGKIPAQASSSNQLADKAFVNSSVQTATANFRGNWETWADVPTNVNSYPEDYAGSKTPTTNDYLVVRDASGYTEATLEGTWRFKYSGVWATSGKSGWNPEYQVNETPMTAAQLAAINSGITTSSVGQIAANATSITGLQTGKQDKLTAGQNITINNNVISAAGGSEFTTIQEATSASSSLTFIQNKAQGEDSQTRISSYSDAAHGIISFNSTVVAQDESSNDSEVIFRTAEGESFVGITTSIDDPGLTISDIRETSSDNEEASASLTVSGPGVECLHEDKVKYDDYSNEYYAERYSKIESDNSRVVKLDSNDGGVAGSLVSVESGDVYAEVSLSAAEDGWSALPPEIKSTLTIDGVDAIFISDSDDTYCYQSEDWEFTLSNGTKVTKRIISGTVF